MGFSRCIEANEGNWVPYFMAPIDCLIYYVLKPERGNLYFLVKSSSKLNHP